MLTLCQLRALDRPVEAIQWLRCCNAQVEAEIVALMMPEVVEVRS